MLLDKRKSFLPKCPTKNFLAYVIPYHIVVLRHTSMSLKTDRSLFGAALFIGNLQQTSSPRSRTSCVSKCLFSSSPSPHHHVWSPECHSTLWTQMLCSELVLHGDSPMATEESNKVTKQMKWLGARRPRAVFTLSQLLNMHSRCMRCCGGR